MHRRESLETGLAQALGNSPAQAGLRGGRRRDWKEERVPRAPWALTVAVAGEGGL